MGGKLPLQWWAALALAAVLAMAMVPVSLAQQATKEIQVEMGEFYFKPKEITVTAGERVRITVSNVGAIPHEFEISRLGAKDVKWTTTAKVPDDEKKDIDEHAARGTPEVWLPGKAVAGVQTGSVEFTAVNPGSFAIKCEIEGHTEAGMTGTLTVVAASAPAVQPIAAPAAKPAAPAAQPAAAAAQPAAPAAQPAAPAAQSAAPAAQLPRTGGPSPIFLLFGAATLGLALGIGGLALRRLR